MDEAAPAAKDAKTNIPEYSVGELSGAIKRTLEGAFGRIRVRGEITEYKLYSSGHAYLSLKDEGGKIRAVIWKTTLPRLGLRPENGVEVIATGKISAYGDRSEYQLMIDRLEYAGAGALLARIELLRQRLAAEGLFEAAGKKTLPVLPALVGVITSASGAVLHDIMTTIARRFPRPILLWPVPVQGEGAAAKIAAAIAGMDRLPAPGIARPDVLIVARGGGSLEDLMAFNEEVVLRAAAACRLPLISAVGHETDTTLIDYVSDRRAPTPTAAAELAVPSRTELLADLAQKSARLAGALDRVASGRRAGLAAASARLPDLPAILGQARLRLDDRALRLELALPNLLAARQAALARAERHIPDPHALIAARRGAVDVAGLRLLGALRASVARHRDAASRVLPRLTTAGIEQRLRAQRGRLDVLGAQLEGASYQRVLARGFALVRDANGHPVTQAAAVGPAARLTLRFADGDVRVTSQGKQGSLPL
jgi:exodeoxyribonuclease VII large subunit